MRIKTAIEWLPWPILKPPVQTASNFARWKKGARLAEVGALGSVYEKSATERKQKQNLLTWKRTIQIATFNVRTLNHHHHHVVLVAWISLTLSRHFSLSFIASGRSSGLHPVSSHSCWMYVRAGRPAFVRSYVGVQKSTSLLSSSLLLQQCPVCLVRVTWIVFVIGGRWPYSWCLVGCCSQHSCVIAV